MTNEQTIRKYANDYKEKYFKEFGEYPESWFSYLYWLAKFTSAGSFTNEECMLAESLLK